jgi:hypothetical protein
LMILCDTIKIYPALLALDYSANENTYIRENGLTYKML